MLKIASCMYCPNKNISMAFNVIFVSSRCAYNLEVIFYRNSFAGPVVGGCYWELSTIFVNYLESHS